MDINEKLLSRLVSANDGDNDLDNLVNGVLYSTSMQDCFMDSMVTMPCDNVDEDNKCFSVDNVLFQDQFIDQQQQSLSIESLTDEGSPYSIGYASPHGSTDSGILLSSPDSPTSPSSNASIQNYNALPDLSNIDFSQQSVAPMIFNQYPIQAQTQLENDPDKMIDNLKQLITFFSNNDQIKDHLQKQQEQQKMLEAQVLQQSLEQRALLAKLSAIQNVQGSNSPDISFPANPIHQTFNSQLTMGTPVNIVAPSTISNPVGFQSNMPSSSMNMVDQTSQSNSQDINSNKENHLRKIFDKTKNQFLINIKETKDKMKLKSNKLGKRKLPNNSGSPNLSMPVNIKQTKVQNPVLDLEAASSAVNNLQSKSVSNLQNSTLASLLLQPKVERKESEACSKPTPIAPATVENLMSSKNAQLYLNPGSNGSSISSQNAKDLKSNNKRTRVEHVVIEKRYRMKITESLKELKKMLGCEDEKKSTKNGILQAAIIEIKRLRRENASLKKKTLKMRRLFEELRNIGIIPESQIPPSSTSGSENSDHQIEPAADVDEEEETSNGEPVNGVDHHAFPLSRQSARDGLKTMTCFAMFLFLFITPFSWMATSHTVNNGAHYSSRHLLSVLEHDSPTSPQFFLFSKIVQILMSLMILMFMILHGNPKCSQNPEIVLSFKGHLRKAQKKINKKSYDDAKGMLRIALFIIGNSCPKTLHGQWASFLWKCICHILFQLGILTTLESMGRIILPSVLSGIKGKNDQNFTASLSMKAYIKLHEVAIKDPSSTYLETACYLMNAVHCAEVSGDQELIATAYSTAVVHMKEKVKYCSILLQYYFTSCAHHASLLGQDSSRPYAVDWIFERYGYDYFVCGEWDVHREPAFHVQEAHPELDEADLLQTVYAQFQDHNLTKALKRLVLPETFYPNEGKIELRHRALSILQTLGTGSPSEQTDSASLYHHSIYGWWKCALKNMLLVVRNEKVEWNDIEMEDDFYRDITEEHRSHLIVLAKSVITAFMAVHDLKNRSNNLSTEEMLSECVDVRKKILEASQHMNESIKSIDGVTEMYELEELIQIMCCDLLLDAGYMLWSLQGDVTVMTEQELNFFSQQKEMLQYYSFKYAELFTKVQMYDHQIQKMSGSNDFELRTIMKRCQHIKQATNQPNELSHTSYFATQNYPLKQDGFVRP